MDEDKLLEKIIYKELTICETCDNIFTYIPQKVFCDECNREKYNARKRAYNEKNKQDPEWVKKENARKRATYEKNKQDPEWVAKHNARKRAFYHANKKKNASK
jgi:hypothetical protein